MAIIGEVPGIPEGTTFESRDEASKRGVHRARMAGIVGTELTGAESIVVSGGYEDDVDKGSWILYTGHGGQDKTKKQVKDQTFESSGNAALRTSNKTGAPVRVVRKMKPPRPGAKYRYDGLFRVAKVRHERGSRGHLVCRFELVKEELVKVEAPKDEDFVGSPLPTGNLTPSRVKATVQRLVRSTRLANKVKLLHDHTCQVCGERLTAGVRGYSEVAHIQALSLEGPDVPDNVLCLCANCHVLFDLGALLIADDFTITLNGNPHGKLRLSSVHSVDPKYLKKHRDAYP